MKTEYRIEKAFFNSILYIEGMSDYLQVHLADGTKTMHLQKFSAFEEAAPDNPLINMHKSFMNVIEKIDFIER